MKQFTATTTGFLVAALIPAFIGALLTPFTSETFNTDILALVGLTFFFSFFSIASTIIFGIPAFLLCQRYELVRWWSTSTYGFFVGVLTSLIIQPTSFHNTKVMFLFGAQGALAGLVFWLIWRTGVKSA